MNFRKNMLSQQDYILHVDMNNNKLQAKENPATGPPGWRPDAPHPAPLAHPKT